MKTNPWMMLVAMMAGWINSHQQDAIAYLKEENEILRDELRKATGIIEPLPQPKDGKIVCQERLGGVLKSYRRAA